MSNRKRILEGAWKLFNERGSRSVTTNHIAEHLEISPGNLPPGTSARLLSLKSEGGGETVFDLQIFAPRSASLSLNTMSEMTINAEGESENMTMKMDMDMEMKTE